MTPGIMKQKARIGMVNFINTAPFYSVWRQTVQEPDWQVIEAVPAELNRQLFAGDLDLGIVSCHEYALHPDQYQVLRELSISASGVVGSVMLFAHREPTRLDGELVLLSRQSQTSNSLVQIILEEFCQVQPRYLMPTNDTTPKAAARLAIGDEALRLRGRGEYEVELDLGEAWLHQTGLPFVFALWLVRRDYWRHAEDTVRQIQSNLLRCVKAGREELASVSRQAAPRIPMDETACLRYLEGIEFDLGPKKIESLTLFFRYLIQRGEVPASALPLIFCG